MRPVDERGRDDEHVRVAIAGQAHDRVEELAAGHGLVRDHEEAVLVRRVHGGRRAHRSLAGLAVVGHEHDHRDEHEHERAGDPAAEGGRDSRSPRTTRA